MAKRREPEEKAVERQTELGMIKVDMEYPYPCVPPPEIREEKAEKLLISLLLIRSGSETENGNSPVFIKAACIRKKSILIGTDQN